MTYIEARFQEPVLFSGTLRQNIDPFEQYADADLFRALDLSHLSSFVETLHGGLSHEISEGGANLRYLGFPSQYMAQLSHLPLKRWTTSAPLSRKSFAKKD